MDHRCFGRNGRGWYDFWLFNKYLHVNRREREIGERVAWNFVRGFRLQVPIDH